MWKWAGGATTFFLKETVSFLALPVAVLSLGFAYIFLQPEWSTSLLLSIIWHGGMPTGVILGILSGCFIGTAVIRGEWIEFAFLLGGCALWYQTLTFIILLPVCFLFYHLSTPRSQN